MPTRHLVLVTLTMLVLTACSKKSEEFQESYLKTNKQTTLYSIKYGPAMRHVMDIALPANRDTNTPVVILIHGGAWIMGDKAYFLKETELFARAGIACATINYRYASDITNVHHPDLPNDVKLAMDYISSKSSKWQVSTQRFGLGGHSAGGHLALLTSYTLNDGRIKACCNWAGPMDLTDEEQLKITGCREMLKIYMGFNPKTENDNEKCRQASPYWTVTPSSVPTMLLHGTNDIGIPYSNAVKMKAKLDQLGVPNEFHTFEGSGHIWTGKDLDKARTLTLQWFSQQL
ncbi:MAG TPA: alpha/beta hydrolase [Chitinophagales bacterium]|nr:alpha/beta hydrolase [Chitinophagales bacterium]